MNRLASALKVRPGEGRTAALAVGMMLAVNIGMGIGGSAVEALLFARQGVGLLPYLFMAVGVLTLVVTLGVTVLLGRLAQRTVYLAMPLALAALLGVERVLVAFDFNWLYPVMWLAMMVTYTLQGLFTWGLAGASLDTRQAKRLFPLFGAGGILGTVIGGLVTRPLVGVLHSANLLIVWALLLLLTFVLGRTLVRGASTARRAARQDLGVLREMQQGFLVVRRTPLLSWLAWGAVTFAILYSSVSFPFARAATAAFPTEDALAGFLGLFQGLSTAAAFLASLFAANRLYARFGLPRAILTLALIYFAGFGALVAVTVGRALGMSAALLSIFAVLVAFRFSQLAWVNGIAGPAYQALLNVAPPERRDQVRAFIDGVPGQAGIVLAGIILLVGERALQPQHLYWIGLGIAVVTAWLTWQAGRAYGAALVEALRTGQHQVFFEEEEPFGGFRRDAAAVAALVAGLSDADPVVRRVAAETLGQLEVPGATDALVAALVDPAAEVRVDVLRALGRARAIRAVLDVALCLDDPEPDVRRQAVETLCRLAGYPRGAAARIRPLLADPAPLVRAQVALELLRVGPDTEARDLLRSMAAMGEPAARVCALNALGEWGDAEAFDLVAVELEDQAAPPAVRRVAAGALVRIDPFRAIGDLIRSLGDPDRAVRQAAAVALRRVGEPALAPVARALDDPKLESGALLTLEGLPAGRAAPTILAYAGKASAAALRYQDAWLHFDSHEALAGLGRDDERRRLLAAALRDRALTHGRRALRALGLLAGRDSMALALESLEGRDPVQRANALETLESLDGRWRAVARPLLRLWEQVEPRPGADGHPPQHAPGVDHLAELLADPDDWVRACAVLAAGATAAGALRPVLEQLAQADPDPTVREAAAQAADQNGDRPMKTLPTLSVMERILLLRRVPLFADLAPADLKQVAAVAAEHFFPDGEVIAREGEPGDELYIITSGEVRVLAGPEQAEVARRESGDYVGEMAVISREPRMATLAAHGNVRLLCLNRTQFEEILRERPETGLVVMRMLIERLKEAQGRGETQNVKRNA